MPPVCLQVGAKLWQKGWGKAGIPAGIAVSAEMGLRLEENVGLDLELTSLGSLVLKFGVQGWVAGAEDVCGVPKGCTSDIRMILGNV